MLIQVFQTNDMTHCCVGVETVRLGRPLPEEGTRDQGTRGEGDQDTDAALLNIVCGVDMFYLCGM